MYSFLILSIIVTPNENRNIFNSATSISASCLFVSATVSNPYNIAGLTATLYTFPFTLAGTLLSQITPDIRLHPFHPACTLFFTSLLHSPLLCTVEPRYLKSSTFATSSCIFNVPWKPSAGKKMSRFFHTDHNKCTMKWVGWKMSKTVFRPAPPLKKRVVTTFFVQIVIYIFVIEFCYHTVSLQLQFVGLHNSFPANYDVCHVGTLQFPSSDVFLVGAYCCLLVYI